MKKVQFSILCILILCLFCSACAKGPSEQSSTPVTSVAPEPADWMSLDTSRIPGQNYENVQLMEIRRSNESYLMIAHVPVTGIQSLDDTLAADARSRMDRFESDAGTLEEEKRFMLECAVTQSSSGLISIVFLQQDTLNLNAGNSAVISVANFDRASGQTIDPVSQLGLQSDVRDALADTIRKKIGADESNTLSGNEEWLVSALSGGSGWDVSITQHDGVALLLQQPDGKTLAVPVSQGEVEQARQSLIVTQTTPAATSSETSTPSISGKLVALTFDDGPNPNNTAHLLDILAEYNVKATFFLQGVNVKANPELVKREYQEGHELGNHTYNHPKLTELSFKEVDEQINKCNDLIEEACGFRPVLMRPPYGSTTYSLRDHLRDVLGMPCIKWSGDLRDSFTSNVDEIVNEALTTTKDGDILLLHDTHGYSVEAVPRIIKGLREQGFTFVTVTQIITRNGDPVKPGESYRYVRPAK